MITLDELFELVRESDPGEIAVALVQDCEPDGTGYRVYEVATPCIAVSVTLEDL